jgi:hypothetical protein
MRRGSVLRFGMTGIFLVATEQASLDAVIRHLEYIAYVNLSRWVNQANDPFGRATLRRCDCGWRSASGR